MRNYRTLVLNQAFLPVSFFPLKTIRAEDAITSVLNNSATVLFNHNAIIKTNSRNDLYWPSVIVTNMPYRDRIRLNNESLYYRDHCVCQYCEKPLKLSNMTRDHMRPRVKGGSDDWNNLVVSCQTCNSYKGHNDAKGIWRPKRLPYEPNYGQMLDIRKRFPITVQDENWQEFLPKWNSDILIQGIA